MNRLQTIFHKFESSGKEPGIHLLNIFLRELDFSLISGLPQDLKCKILANVFFDFANRGDIDTKHDFRKLMSFRETMMAVCNRHEINDCMEFVFSCSLPRSHKVVCDAKKLTETLDSKHSTENN